MKKKGVIILFILILLIISGSVGAFFLLQKEKIPTYSFITAERGYLVREVSVTGKIKSKEKVNLGFELSGKIEDIYVKEAERVEKGDPLSVLNRVSLKAEETKAKATLEAEQIRLDELLKGTRNEEIKIAETKIANAEIAKKDAEIELTTTKEKAKIDLNNLYYGIEDIVNSSYVHAFDAVNNKTNEFFSNDLTDSPVLSFAVGNSQIKIDCETKRVIARNVVDSFNDNSSLTEQDLLERVGDNLVIINDFLNTMSSSLDANPNLTASVITTYKGYINIAKTNINTSLSNVRSQIQSILLQKVTNNQNIALKETSLNQAQNNLNTALDELSLKKAGYTEEQVGAQRSKVNLAKANLDTTRANLDKAVIISPIRGIISMIDIKKGEYVSLGQNIISIISENDYEIESFIPEIEIGRVMNGQRTKVVFDAFPEEEFFAFVFKIDLDETPIEGVATYKTILEFREKDERIKPGMSCDLEILTAERNDVIFIPQRAVISKNGDKFVRRVLPSGNFEEVIVETGLRGSSGNIEIISGIREGDKIITFLDVD